MSRILLVDDERENIDLLTQFLSQEGHTVQSAADADTTVHRLKAWKPHLVLLDINLPNISGLDLIPKIRAATTDDYASIILVSANMSLEDIKKGFDSGADDYLTKPFRAQELLSRVKMMLRFKELQDSLRRSTHRVDELTLNDELTGLMNIRAFFRKGEEEILRARRFKKPISVMLINLDGFSEINQNHGFNFGNTVIQGAAKTLKQCLRSIDLAGRVGADEFLVLLLETDLAGAEFNAERVKDAIQAAEFKSDKHSAKLTASIGVAGFSSEIGRNPNSNEQVDQARDQNMSELFRIATEALRSAKANGPNKIEVYSFA